jgi:membrane-bound serine protease (ClpP class)
VKPIRRTARLPALLLLSLAAVTAIGRSPHLCDSLTVAKVGLPSLDPSNNSCHSERSEEPPYLAFAPSLGSPAEARITTDPPHLLFTAFSPEPTNIPLVVRLTLHDTVQPISADYLRRGLSEAARLHASAVLLSLGTPGGLLTSTREMVETIEDSPVPVIIYIEPAGSRAGSAGFFLLESADIAAMAPGTNAGAAHPIVEGRTMDPILKEKVENDAAAFLRSYVQRRGRNVAAAEDAVRNSKSYSAQEALNLNLIDLIANNENDLLAALDGKQIERFNGQKITLHLHDAHILNAPPSQRERLLFMLANPDFAVLLLAVGGLLIYLEFNVPGTIVPGALGTLLFLLGIFGLNLLPIRHTALLLLAAAFVLLLLEVKFSSHGVLAAAGIGALVVGLATLVDAPIDQMQVHNSTALAVGIAFGTITFGLAWLGFRARRNKVLTGPAAMIGKQALVRAAYTPHTGQVEVRGELWQARLESSPTPLVPGAPVLVKAVDGLTLIVESVPFRS